MQFIIDLIWDHSRSRYLVALSERKAGQWSRLQRSSAWSAWLSSPLTP